MRAIVLVGGEGTRLRPLTWRTPKQLVPVLNRPLLEHLLLHLRAHEVRQVTLAMTQRNPAIREAFGDGSQLGIELEYAYEDTPLGSGGAIASIARGWDETFLVCNGDIITDLDLSAMFAFHREHASELTIHLHEVEDPSAFGVAVLDGTGRITQFVEKPPRESAPSRLINAGNWVFEPSAARELDATTFNQVERGLFPAMCEAGRAIHGYSAPSFWMDVGNPEALRLVNLALVEDALAGGASVEGTVEGRAGDGVAGVLVGAGTQVAEGARVRRPAVIGRGCRVGDEATVERSVLWDDVVVGSGATVRNSVVASGVQIGAGAVVEHSVVAHGARVAPGARLIDESVEPDDVVEAEG